MSRDTDDLRAALEARARVIAVPPPDGLEVLRLRVLLARVRTGTAVSAAVLLVAGLIAAIGIGPASERTTTVDLAGGRAPSTTWPASETATTIHPAGGGPAGAGDDGGAGAGAGPPTSLRDDPPPPTTVPGPVDTPPDEAPAEIAYALAAKGWWMYEVDARRVDMFGDESSLEDYDLALCVEAPSGRLQRQHGLSNYLLESDTTRDVGDGIGLRQLAIFDDIDTTYRFELPTGAFAVPRRPAWGTDVTYEAMSSDGTTRLRATVRVEGLEEVAIEGRLHDLYVQTVRTVSTIVLDGQTNTTTQRTAWWGVDLGVPVRIVETTKGTGSNGSRVDRWVDATIADGAPDPAYREVPSDCRA